jgi:subtilisin family serine protease
VRFKSADQKIDALQSAALSSRDGSAPKFLFGQPDVLHTEATDETRAKLEALGAEIFEDVQFKVFPSEEDYDDLEDEADQNMQSARRDLADDYTLHDVVEQIGAPKAWRHTRGEGVTIAIVDTGIAGARLEFAEQRRSSIDLDSEHFGEHWMDPRGHGSMCAAIAAGSRQDGGRYDGVAPGATVLAARSSLKSTDLVDIYDELYRARSQGEIAGPLVVSNSYGLYVCRSPGILPENHPYLTSVLTAINSGIFVCFAAGNNHHDQCKHDPTASGPNTIWGANSHDDIVSVGTVNREFSNCDPASPHVNSSRGPGEWAKKTTKPDCVAPTYGEVPWGTTFRRMRWWGTSGACPQVAGAAALMLSVCPTLTPSQVAGGIRETCSSLPEAKTCVGHGLLDCEAAVEKALNLRLST